MRPGTGDLKDGTGLNPHLNNAVYEHEIENGVLTAVEDFVAEYDGELEVIKVPGLHGLGLVVPAERVRERPALGEAIGALGSAEFLGAHAEWIERARVEQLVDSVQQRAAKRKAEQRSEELAEALEQEAGRLAQARTELHEAAEALAAARLAAAERAAESERAQRRTVQLEDELQAAERSRTELEEALARSTIVREPLETRAAESTERAAKLEAQARELEEHLSRAEAARGRLEAELARAQAAVAQKEDEIASVASRAARLEASIDALRAQDEKTRASERARAEEFVATLSLRERELATSREQLEQVREALRGLEQERDASVRQTEKAAARQESLLAEHRAELARRETEHERRVAELERDARMAAERLARAHDRLDEARLDLAAVDAHVKRAAASRSWRWGHSLARLLRKLTFRADKGTSALDRASARIARSVARAEAPSAPRVAAPSAPTAAVPAPVTPPQPAGLVDAPAEARAIMDTFIRDLGHEWVTESRDRGAAYVKRLEAQKEEPPLRVLVGTLHSGENEFERSKDSIARQDYPAFEHVVISGLPKQESVATLMDRFLDSDFDILVKVDADTVLLEEDFLSRVVEIFQSAADRDLVQLAMLDFFSGQAIQGINAYRRTIDWRRDRQDRLFTDKTFVDKSRRLVVWGPFVRSAIHSPDPSPFQAFHFGVHRGLKARQPLAASFNEDQAVEQTVYLEKTWEHFRLRRDRRLALACLGFEQALSGRYEIEHLDYTNPALERAFQEFSDLPSQGLEALVEELRERRVSPGHVHQVRKRRRTHLSDSNAPIRSILVPLPHFGIYGGVNRFFSLAERFQDLGVECVLAKPDAAWGFYRKKGLPEKRPDFPRVRTTELSQALARPWDVVLCGDCTSGVILTMPHFKARINAVYLLNGWRHRDANLRQIELTEPDLVIANSSWAARYYRDVAPAVVPGGIDAALFAADDERVPLDMPREEAAWPGERLRIVTYGGRQKPIKRFEDTLEACRLAWAAGIPLELHVFDERPVELDPGFPLIYHGKLDREAVADLMRDMDVVVSAEEDAGWSNPTAEAMASGASVICTEAGTCDFAIDGETALVVPVGRPDAIAEAIGRLWRDPALGLDLRRNGVRRMGQFKWETVAGSLLELFNDIRRDDSRRQALNERARRRIGKQLLNGRVPA